MHQTRLRLGLSHLRAHLFQHNLIVNPTCQFCGLEPETTSHYILKCPTYTVHRVRFLMGITNLLDAPYIAGLNDDKIVQLFLHGDPPSSHETNENIISLAQSFIVKVQELNSGTEASFPFFISNIFRSVKHKNIAFRMFLSHI